jgi:fructose-1,6-bisphosphatase/inositol monophosphatase family enzyme
MVAIRNERLVFEAHIKKSHGGSMDDFFTSADRKAQNIYLRAIKECFPNCGIIAEEGELQLLPKNGCRTSITVDPLDGTRAFVRRQSHGVGTMIALINGDEVVSAYIGDINTFEIYGYRPGSKTVWRVTGLDTYEKLEQGGGTLRDKHILLRDPESAHSEPSRKLLSVFKNYEVGGGSIGIWAARLWKGEVGALLLDKAWETPWDANPIIGISLKLGYAFLRPNAGDWEVYHPVPVTEKFRREHDLLIVHQKNLDQIMVPKGIVKQT